MADGLADDDDDEGVLEEKRLADEVRADSKVRQETSQRSRICCCKYQTSYLTIFGETFSVAPECCTNGNTKQARQRHNE